MQYSPSFGLFQRISFATASAVDNPLQPKNSCFDIVSVVRDASLLWTQADPVTSSPQSYR